MRVMCDAVYSIDGKAWTASAPSQDPAAELRAIENENNNSANPAE
jgi:hypothetical protein